MKECKRINILLLEDKSSIISNILNNKPNRYSITNANAISSLTKIESFVLSDIILLHTKKQPFKQIKEIKNHCLFSNIPILIIDNKFDNNMLLDNENYNKIDFLDYPFTESELTFRINKLLFEQIRLKELNDNIKDLYNTIVEVQDHNSSLQSEMNELQVAATTDFLTGAYNKRFAVETLKFLTHNKKTPSLSIVMADIDNFKKLNDCYGHSCGDYVLKAVTNTIQSTLRSGDIFCRWGGEEFLIILPNTNINMANKFTDRVRKLVSKTSYKCSSSHLNVTMTFGIAEFDSKIGINGTLVKADEALYRGKNNGKNTVVIHK